MWGRLNQALGIQPSGFSDGVFSQFASTETFQFPAQRWTDPIAVESALALGLAAQPRYLTDREEHHQAISDTGSLHASVWSPAGVVEAIEGPGCFGLQWHPKLSLSSCLINLAPFVRARSNVTTVSHCAPIPGLVAGTEFRPGGVDGREDRTAHSAGAAGRG